MLRTFLYTLVTMAGTFLAVVALSKTIPYIVSLVEFLFIP